MFKKLKSTRGETIVESLVSILVVTLSASILAMLITSSVKISHSAEEVTATLYSDLSAAESGVALPDSEASGNVTIKYMTTNQTIAVTYYGTKSDTLTTYERAVNGG